jgi:hypothetical protein
MAVITTKAPSRLTLRLQTGYNAETGKPILKSYSYSYILATASPEALYSLASTLSTLTALPLNKVLRVDTAELAE